MSLNTAMGVCLVGIGALYAAVGGAVYAAQPTAAQAKVIQRGAGPYYEASQYLEYDAPGVSGGSTKTGIIRYLSVKENPSGSCTRLQREGLNFVKSGNGYEPQYRDSRKVIACPVRDTPEYVAFIKQLRIEFTKDRVQGLPSKTNLKEGTL